MSVEFKDYYRTLGVDRNADAEEIRKAFRKLARQYHPDVARDKRNAEEKFKAINEAYEVLGDPEKRKRYDELGANWKDGDGIRPPPGWESHRSRQGGPHAGTPGGFDFHFGGTGFSDFFEQFFGSTRGSSPGRGTDPFTETARRGQDVEADLLVPLEEALHGATRTVSLRRPLPCSKCGGSGELKGRRCPDCNGSGITTASTSYKVRIPAGVREGQRLRLAGRGDAGSAGADPGDLYLNVRYARHPDFHIAGNTLIHDLDLAPWEAALGAQIQIPTLDGRVSIKVPAGSGSGRRLRVRGQGLPSPEGRGDLIVVLRIQVPASPTEKERALWEQLARESRFRPRD